MISCTTTSFLLFAIGAIIPPATMAFSVAFVSNANPHRGAKLHYYLGEDGYAGFPREFPMDQYAPSPMDQYAPSPMDQYTPSAMEFEAVVYDRAVDCAHNPGMCNLDELMDLARDLEEFQECYVEYGPEACQEEAEDRQMLADALLVQREIEIENIEMNRMQFGGGGMMYDNGFTNSNTRMRDDTRYQNRAMPNSGKNKGTGHDRSGFIDV